MHGTLLISRSRLFVPERIGLVFTLSPGPGSHDEPSSPLLRAEPRSQAGAHCCLVSVRDRGEQTKVTEIENQGFHRSEMGSNGADVTDATRRPSALLAGLSPTRIGLRSWQGRTRDRRDRVSNQSEPAVVTRLNMQDGPGAWSARVSQRLFELPLDFIHDPAAGVESQ